MQPSDSSPGPGKSTGRRMRLFAACLAGTLLLGFLVVQHSRASTEAGLASETRQELAAAPSVDVVTAKLAPATLPLVLPGQTSAWYNSTIYARVDGYVGSWKADIGDHVHKGDVLATIETPDLDAQLAAAQAQLKASQATVVSRQADAEFTKSTYQRWKDSPNGVVSEQERDAKKADYDRAMARLNEAQAQLGLDQANIDRYTVLTQFKQVTAPYDGIITARHIDIGNLVTSGSTSTTTQLYRIVQDDPIRVFVDLPQSLAQQVKTDLTVHVISNDLPGKTFDGKVVRTAEAIDAQTRTLRVEVDIPNADHALVSGMYVNAAFDLPTDGLVQMPAAALVFRSSGPEVAVIGKDGKVDFRKVTIARDNGGTVEISSG
ncbi:MAG: efflux RND transporter periplasmic adaptor subunit, partial [Dongiaceae bacterium]